MAFLPEGYEKQAKWPPGPTLRALTLSFLIPTDIRNAAGIHESWREAAAEPSVWRGPFSRSSSALLRSLADERLVFPSAEMYWAVWNAAERGPLLLRDLMSAAGFYRVAPRLLGSSATRLDFQFPMLCLLLHSPRFLATTGGESSPRYLLFYCNVVRWHLCQPSASNVPWLLWLYAWAATQMDVPFHPWLLLPARALIECPVLRLDDGEAHYLLDLTVEFILKQQRWDTLVSRGSENEFRLLGVIVLLMQRFPSLLAERVRCILLALGPEAVNLFASATFQAGERAQQKLIVEEEKMECLLMRLGEEQVYTPQGTATEAPRRTE